MTVQAPRQVLGHIGEKLRSHIDPVRLYEISYIKPQSIDLVVGGGFEPPKASPTDLQSVPFDHSGTPPKKRP